MIPDDPAIPPSLDGIYEDLKRHDQDWLEKTLRSRWRQPQPTRNANSDSELNPRSEMAISTTLPLGPHDITAPEVGSGYVMSAHVARFRRLDWAATELGPMSSWSPELRRMVNLCMNSPRSATLWWGHTSICIHNELYQGILADRREWALGRPLVDVWPELAGEAFNRAFDVGKTTGRASSADDGCFFLMRQGQLQEIWASWAISPIPGTLGWYNTVVQSTQQILYKRRMSTLLLLERQAVDIDTLSEYWKSILTGLEPNDRDVPFAAVYSADYTRTSSYSLPGEESAVDFGTSSSSHSTFDRNWDFSSKQWTLQGTICTAGEDLELPTVIPPHSASQALGPLLEVALSTGKPQLLRVEDATFPPCLQHGVPNSRGFGDQCTTAVLLPIRHQSRGSRAGALLIGLNTRRFYDNDYEEFIQLLATQLVRSFAAVTIAEDEALLARRAANIAAQERIRLSENLAITKQEAKANELRFRAMADQSPIAMFEFNENAELEYANKTWFHLTEHPAHSPSNQPFAHIVLEADRAKFDAHWDRLLEGESVRFEIRFVRPFVGDDFVHGEKLEGETWVLVAAYAERRANGEVKAILGCLVDISRQKWMARFQERQTQEALELKRQQEAFMDMTSHETRNPLAAIMLCTDNLLNTFQLWLQDNDKSLTIERGAVESTLDDAETIMACVQHQKRIIDDVLTLSKLDAGLLTVTPVKVQLHEVISTTLKMFRGEADQADIALRFQIDQSYKDFEVDWVLLDPSRLQQILINLITNSIKFTKNRPLRHITVNLSASSRSPHNISTGMEYPSTPELDRNDTNADDDQIFLSVSVKDTGRGIRSDELRGLFQRFQQASPKTHVNYGGSGLGLFISRELARLQKGAIGVASEYGVGSTFAFFVKASICQPPDADGSPERSNGSLGTERRISQSTADGEVEMIDSDRPAHGSNHVDAGVRQLHILLAEDNVVNQRVMAKQLERAGHHVTVANHGLEALEHICQSHFFRGNGEELDVVLMDVEMPIMNGLECARKIRAMETSGEITSHVPVVAVTANARKEQQKDALNAGMDAVVTKPFRMADILPVMQRLRRVHRPRK